MPSATKTTRPKSERSTTTATLHEKDADRRALEDKLVEQYLPIVKSIVNRMMSHLPPHVDFEDLHSIGIMGLVAAIKKYDASQGNTFEAYARMRIRGAILDELRRLDCLPRTARAKARKLQEVIGQLEQKLGRAPRDEEIRAALDMTPKEFRRMMTRVRPVSFISLDGAYHTTDPDAGDLHESIPDESQSLCHEKLQKQELIEMVGKKINQLPERQRKILAMYYFEGMRLAEIAEVFGVTEARICQIQSQALGHLRKYVTSCMAR